MPDEGTTAATPPAPPAPAASSPAAPRSYFLTNFSRGDWIGLFAATVAFLGFLGWIMDKVAAASVGDIKADIAVLKAGVAASEGNLKTALDGHTKTVTDAINGALDKRTDEISRSLVALFGDGQAVIVRVANVPMNEPMAMTAVQDLASKFAAGTTLATFGDKAVVEAVVDGMVDEKARSLQTMIETLSGYPSVQTDIMFADPGQIGALKSKFPIDQSQQQ